MLAYVDQVECFFSLSRSEGLQSVNYKTREMQKRGKETGPYTMSVTYSALPSIVRNVQAHLHTSSTVRRHVSGMRKIVRRWRKPNSNWRRVLEAETQKNTAEVHRREFNQSCLKMTSTLKGITLKGSAELVAEFFCEYLCLWYVCFYSGSCWALSSRTAKYATGPVWC